MNYFKVLLTVVIYYTVFCMQSCQSGYTPKPRAYYRIDMPDKSYEELPNSGLAYSFQIPTYAKISLYNGRFSGTEETSSWLNVDFPDFNAHIHLTYKIVGGNLAQLIEDAHTFVYKHAVKADAITKERFENSTDKVYGIVYHIKGNTASSLQFFCTDSIRNFLRGALYIDSEPNKDSLAPVIDFLGRDIEVILKTLKWQNISD